MAAMSSCVPEDGDVLVNMVSADIPRLLPKRWERRTLASAALFAGAALPSGACTTEILWHRWYLCDPMHSDD